jgi:hypothetical protein
MPHHSPPLKYFRGGNIPLRKISAPHLLRISSDQFTHPRSLNPKKCRALSCGANPRLDSITSRAPRYTSQQTSNAISGFTLISPSVFLSFTS